MEVSPGVEPPCLRAWPFHLAQDWGAVGKEEGGLLGGDHGCLSSTDHGLQSLSIFPGVQGGSERTKPLMTEQAWQRGREVCVYAGQGREVVFRKCHEWVNM